MYISFVVYLGCDIGCFVVRSMGYVGRYGHILRMTRHTFFHQLVVPLSHPVLKSPVRCERYTNMVVYIICVHELY